MNLKHNERIMLDEAMSHVTPSALADAIVGSVQNARRVQS